MQDAARIRKAVVGRVVIRRIGFRRRRPIKGGEGINEKTRSASYIARSPFFVASRGGRDGGKGEGHGEIVSSRWPGELLGGHSAHVLERRGARGFPTTIIFGLGRERDCPSLTPRDRAVGQGGLLRT